ncbi:SWIM zinc finger domain-containing protein [Paenibacillus macerans]|uniref:SWIM zinc finger family protein n=1 Tax=Paenibacillus macerans TaxID=44252 RepID=UPI00203CF05E|nr:SWIM zinc finger family protein [Paenibacillus macerans]MCM3701372.1 hypothetical protein [Paenibacillus macerans]
MNIYHFEDDLTDAILDKGYDYYLDDRVVDVYHQGDRAYIIQVEGSDDYEVVVKLDENGEILRSHCDCPYAYGPICKHEVAAYYVLSDMLNSEGECEESDETLELKAAKPPELKEVLQQLPKEELIGIIMDVARKDAFLRNSLLLKYAKVEEQQELESCRRLIQSIVRKHTGRDGFIPYGATADFTREMGEVFEKAGNSDNPLLAVDIALLLMEEAIEAFQYADDSDGDIGALMEETLELIGEIAAESHDLDAEQRQRVFEKLMERSDGEIFEGWDEFHIGLLRICAGFVDVEALRNKLRTKIEQLISQTPATSIKITAMKGCCASGLK